MIIQIMIPKSFGNADPNNDFQIIWKSSFKLFVHHKYASVYSLGSPERYAYNQPGTVRRTLLSPHSLTLPSIGLARASIGGNR